MTTPSKDAKISAIASYFTFIGWLIGFFINLDEKHEFANFHLRQSLGIQTLFYATGALLPLTKSQYAGYGFLLCFFVLWGYAVGTAVQNEMKPVPLVGNLFQKLFKFIK